jgi:hypothetical protein
VKSDGKCDRADCRTEHDRCGDKHGVPQDDALDFKCGHAGVVHRRDAPATMAPPSHGPWRQFGVSDTASPAPVRKIAATSDSMVKTIL